jgi:hypothetical protein
VVLTPEQQVWNRGITLGDPPSVLGRVLEFEAAVARLFHAGGTSGGQPPFFPKELGHFRNIDSSTPTN